MTTLKDFITQRTLPRTRHFTPAIIQEDFEGELGYTVTPATMEENLTCSVTAPECFAKKVKTENGIVRYYVKTDVEANFFDPWGMYSEGTEKQRRYVFKETKLKAFNYYLTFLKTKNRAWKLNAEREHKNG